MHEIFFVEEGGKMFDILIKNGLLVDGTGNKGEFNDVAITDGVIREIAPNISQSAKEIIDASGLIVAPGFIDIHSHSDLCPFLEGLNPQSKLYQGVVLEIIGNCGISNLPVDNTSRQYMSEYMAATLELPMKDLMLEDDSIIDYAEHIKRQPAATNVGVLIGHGCLRGCVMGLGMRKASEAELDEMKALLDRELDRGAFGMSLGLIYPPSSYGDINEFVELAKVIKKHEGILTVHMRSESTKIFEAVEEMLEVVRQSKVHLEISHLKLMGKPQWGKAEKLLKIIKDARAEGLDINCDQYPYTATSTGLSALVPKWAQDGGPEKMCERLTEPESKLLEEIEAEMERRGGAHAVLVTSTHGKEIKYDGLYLDEIAKKMKLEPAAAAARLLAETGGAAHCCYFSLNKEDMLTIMKEKFISVGTDGYALSYDKSFLGTNPHPRSFGTFPRFLQTVRENELMPIEDAVYKITGLPASVLGLKNRGTLQIGGKADVTIFNQERVLDKSEYMDSIQKPEGIVDVIISGKVALRNGEQVNGRFGEVIFHK